MAVRNLPSALFKGVGWGREGMLLSLSVALQSRIASDQRAASMLVLAEAMIGGEPLGDRQANSGTRAAHTATRPNAIPVAVR